MIETPNPEVRFQQRRQKYKTRPAHSSIYDIAPTTVTPAQLETLEISPVFKVKKKDTVDGFSTLFSKSKSRGSINWVAFEAAMMDFEILCFAKMWIDIYVLLSSRF